jgi:hypothetical protein
LRKQFHSINLILTFYFKGSITKLAVTITNDEGTLFLIQLSVFLY